MEVPDDFNFSDQAVNSPEYKRRRKNPELQKPSDGHEKHLPFLPPTVPIKISHCFEKISPALEETPHSLSWMTEESSDSVLKAESSTYSFSEDVEVFTPVLSGDEDKLKNTYRFVCAHAGQFHCSLTNLVFVMEGKGEVLYRVDSWDPRLLDGLGQMKAAGPLYNIDCSAKSVLRLQLPHCVIFSEENKDGLAVAHFTGGNVEIIQPLRVTETHVIIDIRDLSRFGLIWIKTIFGYPIDGQVLLFLRPVTVEQEQKILNVHLLPGNVPVTEVQCFHHNKSYIETSSKCCLFTDRQYSLCCQPENCEVQPMSEIFQLDNFGPNYHPSFEVFLDVNIKEVKLGVVDKTEDGKEVWPRRRILLTAPSKAAEPPAHRRIPETEFVNTHGDKLTQRVSSVMAIADSLKTKKIITPEMWSKIHVAETPQEKMRHLLNALESGGDNAKVEFCRLLKEYEPGLVKELGPHL
ncbi:NACHT, LRR and PYD domains-containing protein 1b allele 3 [Carassius auratus]|uniref:NACHT, LRR and PYD domains-containing protein 1b allele 3 n=1 Tax=Carassius auratus TaxID=7957 RepID=A0A6P6JMH7_CARAU|nr:NACHT, LRR and PYD domains-containing protein 1b allele 3-like [Carassius auratus]